MFTPICFWSIAKRKDSVSPKPGTPVVPIIRAGDLIEQVPFGQTRYFGWCGEPVNNPSDAQYVVYPNTLPVPPGFEWSMGAPAPASLDDWQKTAKHIHEAVYTPPALSNLPSSSFLPANRLGQVNAEQPEQVEQEECTQLAATPIGYSIISSRNNRRVRATNFLLRDIVRVHHFRKEPDSDHCTLILTIEVIGSQHSTHAVEITVGEIDMVGTRILRNLGSAIIYPSAKASFLSHFPILVREKLDNCPQRFVYESSGWVFLPQGQWAYVHDGAEVPFNNIAFQSGFEFGKSCARYPTDRLVRNALKLLGLSKELPAVLIPILYAHLALIWSLFDAAGYPPHMLLFLKGTTGSLKTAVASLLFNFEGKAEKNIPATFRDTSASMEVKMGQYRDRVLLVDDFCPAASDGARRILEQNLEQLVRFYGDGIAKARTNPRLEETYEKRPHGLCAITGEDSAGSYSSLLRCLFITVRPDTYDKDLLAEYQDNPMIWTQYLECFVDFCVNSAPQIVGQIQADFPRFRAEGEQTISERRLIDAYACLSLAARVMLNFAYSVSVLSEAEANRLFTQFATTILTTCQASAEESKGADPAKVFARLIKEGIDRHAVTLPSRGEFEAAPDKFLGYSDNKYWYFWGSRLYDYIRREYAVGGGQFPLSQQKLWECLYVTNILLPSAPREVCSGKFEYTVRASFGSRPRLIRIDPSALEAFSK